MIDLQTNIDQNVFYSVFKEVLYIYIYILVRVCLKESIIIEQSLIYIITITE